MRRTKEEAEKTRQAIMKAAMGVFSKKGYEATTLVDIAREAGFTRGAVYGHFKDKRALFVALVEASEARETREIDAVVATEATALAQLRAVCLHVLRALIEDEETRAMARLLILDRIAHEDLRDVGEGLRSKTRADLADFEALIRVAQASGEVRSDLEAKVVAITAYSLLLGVQALWLDDPDLFSLEEVYRPVIDAWLQGLAP